VRCPFCQARDSRVTDSRAADDGIRRRRQCFSCGERFTTIEAVQVANVCVLKRDGRREEFRRDKLLAGLRKACSKRNVAVPALEAAAVDIEARVVGDGRAEVPSTFIGELAMEALRSLDHIAYIRFASVYRPFADLSALKEAVAALEGGHAADESDATVQLSLPAPEGPEPIERPSIVGRLPGGTARITSIAGAV
jgi:transcriptional repressor NrdR